MKRVNYIVLVLSLVALVALVPNAVSAQEHKRVEVTTYYLPEVSEATKLKSPTTIDDVPAIEPVIEYSVRPETWQIELAPYTFKPAMASYWDYNRAKHFFMKMSAGYPLQSEGKFHYMTQNERVGYFGINVDHDGDFAKRYSADGVERGIDNSYNMQNSVMLHGGAVAGRQMFEATAKYNYDIYNVYAMAGDALARLNFHNVRGGLRYGDDFADLSRLNFSVEAHGGFWSHKIPPIGDEIFVDEEFNVGGSVRAARMFYGNEISLNAGYDMWSLTEDGGYRDTRFYVGADYRRKFGIVDVDAGVTYMYDRVRARDKASHHVMPRVKILVDLQKVAFAPYVELSTTVSQNGVMSLFSANPYIDWEMMYTTLLTMPNTRSYNLSAGFSGKTLSSRLTYRLYGGISFIRNHIFWYVTSPGWFGLHTDDNNRPFVGVEVDCHPIGGLDISLGFHLIGDITKSPYKSSESNMLADLKIGYTHKRWKIYANADVIGGREWSGMIDSSGVAPVVLSMPTKVDLGVGVSMLVSRTVELYVDGYNLLNKKIYDMAHYYRPGVGFMAGVKLNF